MGFRDEACLYRRDGSPRGAEFGGLSQAQRDAIELVQLEDYLARNLFSWMRADARTEAAGKVTQFNDKVLLPANGGLAGNARSIDPNHSFAQATGANQVAAIAGSALFNGREAAIFTGAQGYLSTLTAASWLFLQGIAAGGGGTTLYVFKPISGTGILGSTLINTIGTQHFYTGAAGATQSAVYAAGAPIIQSFSGITVYIPQVYEFSYVEGASPEYSGRRSGTFLSSGSSSGAPSTSAPDRTFNISPSDLPCNMELTDILILPGRDATAVANARRYATLRYGLVA